MDDDEMMRIICEKIFSYLNFEVDLVDDGEKAVKLFAESKEKGNNYDLTLLDIQVISGMNGIKAAEKIWAMDPDACLVAISGDTFDPAMEHYEKYHFSNALPKPFTVEAVEELLKHLLDD